ncbi:hypothetical protein HPB50_018350 [Hyalomma asiaticum]|uniref:Uncharacterized protein n=1 Tax=Hyalomma asiaticum TaxID=266040 RepID=A0ACB7RQH4_HYAAI|nr:hypothetical protein HPB50_018350 [Hyalomma asiaticum]
MWSPTLTTILFIVLSGHRVISTTENPGEISNSSAKICKPRPTVQFLGGRSTCTFTVKEDIDFRRVPKKLRHFSCNCPTSRCSDLDDYHCVQVKETLQVSIQGFNRRPTLKSVTVNASCVCAAPWSQQSASLSDRPLDEKGIKKKVPEDDQA